MNKKYYVLFFLLFLCLKNSDAATWEKLYCKQSTDCFRCVREVSTGGFVLAGYTANFTANDTDAIILRLDANGETMWSYIFNGPGNKEDLFYKVIETDDGGFAISGYSRSFGSNENALYAKLNSNGQLQWMKNWGGTGAEHTQDILELPNGDFIICGYTTSPPAKYYDAFLLRVDQNGNTLWSRIYGGNNYDDANSMLALSDGGFLLGGQSNNQLYLIRTNSNGDEIWNKIWGTSGIDNIECLNYAQGGNAYILAGTTDGTGQGGEDAYVIKTDTAGVPLWSKTIGDNANDGFHRIEKTSDGGYVGVGTSDQGSLTDPNLWIAKLDVNGNLQWQNLFGGDDHDHGYSGQPTSDGGYILTGHTHSFLSNNNHEDAMIIKTNSTGQVTNELAWLMVSKMTSPVVSTCGSATAQIVVEIENNGLQTITNVPVIVEITGAITQTITQTYSGSVSPGQTKTVTFTSTVNMAGGGTFNFHCYTGGQHDLIPPGNYFDKSITVGGTAPPVVTTGSHCGPGTVLVSAASPTAVQWFAAATGGSSLATGAAFTTPYLNSTTTYYAQSGGTCQSARVPVVASITPGLTNPTGVNGARCNSGTVQLSATSSYSLYWYSSTTSLSSLVNGTTYNTPSISSTTTYYVQADDGSCRSNRVAVTASILTPPSNPVTTGGAHCLTGTVSLSATASSPIEWFDVSSGGSVLGTGNAFTTPSLSSTTTFYAAANNGSCSSNRVAAIATISTTPADPTTTSATRCGQGTVQLTANSSTSVSWFASASSGTVLGTGATFTTPSISSTTTYYAKSNNGCLSNAVPATATITPLPSAPSTTGANRCGSGTLILSATAANPIKWFSSSSGGTVLATGNSFTTPSITGTTTYYAAADDGCQSTRTATVATINSIPANPGVTPAARCSSGTVTLAATSSSTLKWYDAATAGNLVYTGSSFTTPTLSSTTTYYVQAENSNCASSRVSVVATVSLTSVPPVTTPGDRCGSGTVVLNATGAGTIKWYTASTGGSSIANGTSFTTPSLSATTTYYALTDNGCKSSRVPAVASINSIPQAPVTTSASMCGSGSLVLTATASDPVEWYDAASGGSYLGNGNSFATPVISSTTTFYAVSNNGSCLSSAVASIASINALPSDPIVQSASNCGAGMLTLIANSSDSLTWFDAPSGGIIVGHGAVFNTPLLTSSNTYSVLASNALCNGNIIQVDAEIFALPVVDLGLDTIIAFSSSYIMDAGPGLSYEWSTSELTQTINATSTGSYCVIVTDSNLCSATDCAYLEFTVGIKNPEAGLNVTVYPNPSHGIISIEAEDLAVATITISDAIGKIVYSGKVVNSRIIDLSYLTSGVYNLNVQDDKLMSTIKLVLQ